MPKIILDITLGGKSMQDMTFARRCCRKFRLSGMLRRVDC